MGDNELIGRRAASQAGAFNLTQARSAGFSSSAVRARLETGQWIQLDHTVYAMSGAPATWERSAWAAVLSRPQAAITHLPALRLSGVPGVDVVPPVILAPRHSNVRSDISRVFETDQFDRIAISRVAGLPVTSVPESLLILARDTDDGAIERLFDQALLAGKLDIASMARTIDREAGRRTPGTPLLRRLTSSRRPSAPSKSSTYLERLLHRLLSDSRVPEWSREEPFLLNGIQSRVDVYVPSRRLVIEADGRNWHARHEDFERDRERDNALAELGIQVLRFTHRMLEREPEKCLRQIIAVCLVRAA